MPTSADGILTAEFDPTRAAVSLTVDGDEWPDPVTHITMTRTPAGQPTVEVRGLVEHRVTGGWYIGSDGEMPLDVDVVYTVTGYDSAGAVVDTTSVTVPTTGAAWGMWLKAPGRVDRTVLVQLRNRGDMGSATQGGSYPVLGGPEVHAWSGTAADAGTIVLLTGTPEQEAALQTLLAEYRLIMIQTGQPLELGPGSEWWFVTGWTQTNQAQVRSDVYPKRLHALQIVRSPVPDGAGLVSTGATYSAVAAQYATYTALLAGEATYGEPMNPGV